MTHSLQTADRHYALHDQREMATPVSNTILNTSGDNAIMTGPVEDVLWSAIWKKIKHWYSLFNSLSVSKRLVTIYRYIVADYKQWCLVSVAIYRFEIVIYLHSVSIYRHFVSIYRRGVRLQDSGNWSHNSGNWQPGIQLPLLGIQSCQYFFLPTSVKIFRRIREGFGYFIEMSPYDLKNLQ
jgi:hypothetical protein